MASKTKSNENVETKKRTRIVVKWQEAHAGLTCSAFSLFMDNKEVDSEKLYMVGRKLQNVFESVSQTIKDGKVCDEMLERRDNLELALTVAGITNSDVVDALDRFISIYNGR